MFALAVFRGVVREVYRIEAWHPAGTTAYAAGLFDYLSGPVAAALTRRMFEITRPGGMMLIPNFLTGVRDSGYMEAFMDWRLIYRNHADMLVLAAALPHSAVANRRVFDGADDAITFLLVTKAS